MTIPDLYAAHRRAVVRMLLEKDAEQRAWWGRVADQWAFEIARRGGHTMHDDNSAAALAWALVALGLALAFCAGCLVGAVLF